MTKNIFAKELILMESFVRKNLVLSVSDKEIEFFENEFITEIIKKAVFEMLFSTEDKFVEKVLCHIGK